MIGGNYSFYAALKGIANQGEGRGCAVITCPRLTCECLPSFLSGACIALGTAARLEIQALDLTDKTTVVRTLPGSRVAAAGSRSLTIKLKRGLDPRPSFRG